MSLIRSRSWPSRLTLSAAVLAALLLPPWQPASAAAPAVTIDSHASGAPVPVGTVRLSGSYTDAYDLTVILDGRSTPRVHTVDPDGDDTGIWYYDLDTTGVDGEIEIAVRAKRTDTRYGVWSSFVTLKVDNPAANVPVVTVTSPADGGTVRQPTPVRVSVAARNTLREVSVRVNGGAWLPALGKQGTYTYLWDPRELGDVTASIEARAVDANGNTGHSPTVYVTVGAGAAEPVRVGPQDRAMWIWERASYGLILNPGSRRLLASTARDADTFGSRPITTLYLGVDRYGDLDMLYDKRPEVRDFVSWAHAQGFTVYATIAGGTQPPFLGGLERYHPRAVRELEKILNYNLASRPGERFDGVNVDIEPYIYPGFAAGKPALQLQWLEILEKMIQRRDAAGSAMAIGPAIPRWLDVNTCCTDITWKGATKPLSEHIQDMSDYISIMDYRDTADGSVGIIAQAQSEIAYAEAIGKPNSVVIGVETLDIAWSGDPETITFREEGRAVAERELRKVYDAFAGSPAFGGIAMHHYDSIRWLPSVWGPNAVYPPMPADSGPPGAVSSPPTAEAFDHQSIDLAYGRAFDDTEVEHYNIYRSTDAGFTPGPENLAGQSRGLTFTDSGLLPDTTHHYRVAAVDAHGNVGPASPAASATTGGTELRPLIIDELTVTAAGGPATVRIRVTDLATGEPVAAAIHGRFTKMAGRYLTMNANSDGQASGVSETIGYRGGEVGFQPLRITAPGYYWASAHDRARNVETRWQTTTPVVADTFVRAGAYADTTYGSASELEVADLPDMQSPDGDRMAYLKAGLGGHPGTATVSARLYFHVSSVSPGSGAVPVTVRALADDSWSENGVSWHSRPSSAGASVLGTVRVDRPGWHSVDVTGAVNANLADAALTLRLSDDTTAGRLVAIDSRDSDRQPYLIIY
ncbi:MULTISPECIES: DNRLRE domain-containing protein [unclassified Micromonospora]|uniref:CBM96 family carbohydrate-binding protein n=4 Tax=Micromonospora TaxID=1873 RepID=UPI00332CF4CD